MVQRRVSQPSNRDQRHVVLGHRRFEIRERLGSHGERFRVFDRTAGPRGSDRVLHILRRTPETRERIRVLRRLSQNSPSLPAIIEYHEIGGRIFVVLPWVEGRVLSEYIGRAKSGSSRLLPVFEALRLFRGLAHGISQLDSRKNIVHGDLKPQNLILAREPDRLVMIDFGSAWGVARTVERPPGDGTDAHYGAPELQRGERWGDFRSDQFSVSLICYEMITLELPYAGSGGQAGLPEFMHYRDEIPPPSQLARNRKLLNDDVWTKVDEVILTGLMLNPEDRYPSPRAWLNAVEDIRFAIDKSTRLEDEDLFIIRLMRRVNKWFPERKRAARRQ